MRSLNFDDTALGLPVAVAITRGLQVLRFTSHEATVTIDGEDYPSVAGADLTNIVFPSDGSFANADITIQTQSGGLIQPGDGARGVLDGWPISIKMFNSANPDGTAFNLIPNATIGSVKEDTRGLATIAVNGPLTHALGPLTEHYALTGRESLGDDRCKIAILPDDIDRGIDYVTFAPVAPGLQHVSDCFGRIKTGVAGTYADYANVYYECTTAGTTDATTAPAYNATIGATTTDGTAVFTTRNAWLRYVTGQATGTFTIVFDSLPDSRASDPTWYVLGGIYVRSGNLSGFPVLPIRAWDPSTLTATLFLPVSTTDIPAGTQFEVYPGCDLTPTMCAARFNNIDNIRAEYFVPPPETKMSSTTTTVTTPSSPGTEPITVAIFG